MLGLAGGSFLYNGSQYISGGSELLLLVPSIAGIVGSVVLPVLGAVPDGQIPARATNPDPEAPPMQTGP